MSLPPLRLRSFACQAEIAASTFVSTRSLADLSSCQCPETSGLAGAVDVTVAQPAATLRLSAAISAGASERRDRTGRCGIEACETGENADGSMARCVNT